MTTELVNRITALLAPEPLAPLPPFVPRQLPDGAIATRIAPSPTGFLHIGTVYAALLCERLAHQSGGVYFIRIEDTDKKREIAGGAELILSGLASFGLTPDEGPAIGGEHGPYLQSERRDVYLHYALKLLQDGRAYPCFATPQELEANTKAQQAAKVRPGYYGAYALWRDQPDEAVTDALDAGKPFVLRFRSNGSHERRVRFVDALKGELELPENDLDIPLIKADGSRLPTYHLAHVVDDYMMGTNLVMRGEEWLPSTPLHLELSAALGLPPLRYAHFALISIIDKNGGGKRKLSKRKDPEADVRFWHEAGYPVEGVIAYLLGLANSNFEDWYRAHPEAPLSDFPVSIEKLAASRSPLLDMMKLEDYCKNVIAALPQVQFNEQLMKYVETVERAAASSDKPSFLATLQRDPNYTADVLAIERGGEKPRKDLAKWSDAYEQYGYFFDDLFAADFAPRISEELANIDEAAAKRLINNFLAAYSPTDDQPTWFEKLKAAAAEAGFALNNAEYKANPAGYAGNVADAAKVIRVKLTGKNRTPDLWTLMRVMGELRIRERLS